MACSNANPQDQLNSPPEPRLESWKEIATYLNRSVRTVRRWERLEELPVHRHGHNKGATVYSSRAELDAWLAERSSCHRGETELPPNSQGYQEPPPRMPRQKAVLLAMKVFWLGLLGLILYGLLFRHWTFVIRL